MKDNKLMIGIVCIGVLVVQLLLVQNINKKFNELRYSISALRTLVEIYPRVYKFSVGNIKDIPDVLTEKIVFESVTFSGGGAGIVFSQVELETE